VSDPSEKLLWLCRSMLILARVGQKGVER